MGSSEAPVVSVASGARSTTVAEPPPESPGAISTRRWILLSFWVIIVFLGLPHWLWTTSIHRAELPLRRMHDWAEGRGCQLEYPLHLSVNASHISDTDRSTFATALERQLNALPDFQLFRFHVDAVDHSTPDSALIINLVQDSSSAEPRAVLRPWEPVLDVWHSLPPMHHSITALISHHIQQVFQDEQQSLSYHLGQTRFSTGKESVLPPNTRADLDARTTRAFKYASRYFLTFSLFTSSNSPSAWDIEEALERYINPLLASLESVSQFTVDTQVQLQASFSPSIARPVYDNSTARWTLRKSDLSGFVNAAEWPLSPSIGSGPTINFVLYIPSQHQSPLVIAETGGNSWLIPQWGGVQILSRADETSPRLSANELAPIMTVFAEQLTSLLGVPSSPPSLPLRISTLARERTMSLILSASSTLGALARLTLKLTSIAIPDSVARSVDETVHRLDRACADIRAGRYAAALDSARIAEAEAESAFFEPSMVGQVYFPDEHKVAVYVPLLGPMAVPLVMSVLKELRSLRRAKKQKIA